jgi:hypothetical protein
MTHLPTKPGDLLGTDASGRLRIDRVIPLTWVLGIVAAGIVNAAVAYSSQQQLIAQVATLAGDIKELRIEVRALSARDVEQGVRLAEHERRIQALEARGR